MQNSIIFVRTNYPHYLLEFESIIALSTAILVLNQGGFTDSSGAVTYVVDVNNWRPVLAHLLPLIDNIEAMLNYLYPTWHDDAMP